MGYKASNYNYLLTCDDGSLRMYNAMNGVNSLLIVEPDIKDCVVAGLDGSLSIDDMPEYIQTELIKRGYLVPEERDEDNIVKIKIAQTVLDERYLHLIIMPTEQCNFRCKYCYETFEKGKMSKTLQDSIIKYIKKNIINYVGLSVTWFGGEPLLALDVVEYLSENFIKICKTAKRIYVSAMTTNGYLLTPNVFEKLYKLNILTYQITLDGFKPQHDNQRILTSGDGTFDVIVNNLEQIRDKRALGAIFTIRTNFTRAIINNIDEYLTFYKKTFGKDSRFSLYVQQAGDWGGERVKKFCGELVPSVHECVLKKIKEYGITLGRLSHFSELQCETNTCYAAKKNSYVIASDGVIYKCTVHFDFPENIVGKLGSDGSMRLNENFNKWIMPFAEIDRKCHNCYSRANCFPVKCPYTLMTTGNTYCPPIGGVNLGMYLKCFHDSLFYRLK